MNRDLLLIGKTGNGKSATGNTILGRPSFTAKPSLNSVTKDVSFDYSEYKGRFIKVVDGPGVGDTDLSKEDAVTQVMEAMTQTIVANPQGYHAFLLVFRYGARYTKEEIETVYILKNIFGDAFVSKHCILVFTCGDSYDPIETETDSFTDWINQQKGYIADLYRECRGRVILFNNKTKDEMVRTTQVDKLLDMVDHLSDSGFRYADDNFKMAQNQRDKLLLDAKLPTIKEETTQETSLLLQRLEHIDMCDPSEEQLKELVQLHAKAARLVKSLKEQDKGTGGLKGEIKNGKNIVKCIEQQQSSTKQAILMKAEAEKQMVILEMLKSEKEQQSRVNLELLERIRALETDLREGEDKLIETGKLLKESKQRAHAEFMGLGSERVTRALGFIGSLIFKPIKLLIDLLL